MRNKFFRITPSAGTWRRPIAILTGRCTDKATTIIVVGPLAGPMPGSPGPNRADQTRACRCQRIRRNNYLAVAVDQFGTPGLRTVRTFT